MLAFHDFPQLIPGDRLLAVVRSLPWPQWFDSGASATGAAGRYDIVVAAPSRTLVSVKGRAVLRDAAGRPLAQSSEPLALLRQELARRRLPESAPPFCGGAAGYFSYELGARLQQVASCHRQSGLPELALGFYDWALISDHRARRSWWVGREDARAVLPDLLARLATAPEPPRPFIVEAGSVTAEPGWSAYRHAFAQVQAHLRAGDCYQVNLARRFQARYRGDPWSAYLQLRSITPAPYGAYLELPFVSILSVSPERFLLLEGELAESRPIKGTRPRREEPVLDAAEAEALRGSGKDQAENVMIVDLLRNDLGKVCRPGSVTVPQLCVVESHPNVHHLVSTVQGRLGPGLGAVDLLAACLPGGSITGAPKRRAMEIIDRLEPASRGIYCGSIAYLSDDGRMDSSIAIRTAVCRDGLVSYWAGGGLVADSRAEAEFEETLHKARPFLSLVERARA
ncbi:MAG: aminodeoxychorismate synthase component I [Xanthomonadaceae bacterium]|nr:aminodeoxychorismate synthase component I [Xanthomonadaceae bacterium]